MRTIAENFKAYKKSMSCSIIVGDKPLSPEILNVVVRPGSAHRSRLSESKRRLCSQLIEDEPLYQDYYECMLSNVKNMAEGKCKLSSC